MNSNYITKSEGELNTLDYKLYFYKDDKKISPFHDIPLKIGEKVNIVIEIPQGTTTKYEINKEIPFNPIVPDKDKKDPTKVREVYEPYPYHYGALPQTWENPESKLMEGDESWGGDNDPIDAFDISNYGLVQPGTIKQVEVLGILAFIDDGETDWKVICMDTVQAEQAQYTGKNGFNKLANGEVIKKIINFLKVYKIPIKERETKKTSALFAFNEQLQDANFALTVIEETHKEWQKLIKGHINSDIALDYAKLEQPIKQPIKGELPEILTEEPATIQAPEQGEIWGKVIEWVRETPEKLEELSPTLSRKVKELTPAIKKFIEPVTNLFTEHQIEIKEQTEQPKKIEQTKQSKKTEQLGGRNEYYSKYIKYKAQYLKMKNKK